LNTNNHEVSIGNRQSGAATAYDRPWTGAVDDLRVYSRALTSADVQALYSAAALPPAIIQQPANPLFIYTGRSGLFSVNASGAPTGTYFCIITNVYGAVTSIVASFLTESVVSFNTNGAAWSLNTSVAASPPTIVDNVLSLTLNTGSSARSSFYTYPMYIGGFQ